MNLVQLKNHRENKQTVQKRHTQYSRTNCDQRLFPSTGQKVGNANSP